MKKTLITAILAGFAISAAAADYYVVVPVKGKTEALSLISLAVAPFTLPAGVAGSAYGGFNLNSVLTVTGDPVYAGTGAKWSVTGGALPSGMALSLDGVISGVPAAQGVSDLTVTATYKTKTGQQSYQLAVTLPVTLALQTVTGTPLTSVSFGSVPVGLKGEAVVRVVNQGANSVPLSVPAVAIAAPFSVQSQDCASSLGAGAFCTVKVTMNPPAEVAYSASLKVAHGSGEASLGPFTGTGGPLEVELISMAGSLSPASHTFSDFQFNFKNKTGAEVRLVSPISDYNGAFKYEPNGAVLIPANGTASQAGRIALGAPGTHVVPITFQVVLNGVAKPVTMATATFNVPANGYSHNVAETFSANLALAPELERLNYTGRTDYSWGHGVSNVHGTLPAALKAVIVRVPSNAVNPSLTLMGQGRDGSNITVHQNSVTGAAAGTKYFGATETYSLNLVAGQTYYVVPRNNGSYSAMLQYLGLRWN